jgi:hypothetical protein
MFINFPIEPRLLAAEFIQALRKLPEPTGLNLVQHNYFHFSFPSSGISQAPDLQ